MEGIRGLDSAAFFSVSGSTLPSDKNAILIGPVTIATGIGITIESGATLLIA